MKHQFCAACFLANAMSARSGGFGAAFISGGAGASAAAAAPPLAAAAGLAPPPELPPRRYVSIMLGQSEFIVDSRYTVRTRAGLLGCGRRGAGGAGGAAATGFAPCRQKFRRGEKWEKPARGYRP
jgi:hypothetical protein